MYKVWCEFDIGQDYEVFSTAEKARDWASRMLTVFGYEKEDYDTLVQESLIGLTELNLDS